MGVFGSIKTHHLRLIWHLAAWHLRWLCRLCLFVAADMAGISGKSMKIHHFFNWEIFFFRTSSIWWSMFFWYMRYMLGCTLVLHYPILRRQLQGSSMQPPPSATKNDWNYCNQKGTNTNASIWLLCLKPTNQKKIISAEVLGVARNLHSNLDLLYRTVTRLVKVGQL